LALGGLHSASGEYTIKEHVESIRVTLDNAGIKGPLILAGHSTKTNSGHHPVLREPEVVVSVLKS